MARKEDKKGLSALWDNLTKNGTEDGALGYGIAGGIMLAASVIWTIAARRSGSFNMYSLVCLAIGIYCIVQMVKTLGKNKKDGRP